jgi:hypothetical protein
VITLRSNPNPGDLHVGGDHDRKIENDATDRAEDGPGDRPLGLGGLLREVGRRLEPDEDQAPRTGRPNKMPANPRVVAWGRTPSRRSFALPRSAITVMKKISNDGDRDQRKRELDPRRDLTAVVQHRRNSRSAKNVSQTQIGSIR